MRLRRSFSFAISATLFLFLATGVELHSQKTAQKSSRSATSSRVQDREGIAELQKNEIKAMMAMDVSNLLDLWTDDAVLLAPRHEPIEGKRGLRRFLQESKEQYGNYDMLAYNEEWNEVMVTGDYAYQLGTVSYRMKPPTESEIAGSVHVLRVLKRQEDAWRVSRAMWNVAPASTQ